MKRWLLPTLGTLLLASSLGIFYELVLAISRRDYVGGILLLFAGLALVRYGSEATCH